MLGGEAAVHGIGAASEPDAELLFEWHCWCGSLTSFAAEVVVRSMRCILLFAVTVDLFLGFMLLSAVVVYLWWAAYSLLSWMYSCMYW